MSATAGFSVLDCSLSVILPIENAVGMNAKVEAATLASRRIEALAKTLRQGMPPRPVLFEWLNLSTANDREMHLIRSGFEHEFSLSVYASLAALWKDEPGERLPLNVRLELRNWETDVEKFPEPRPSYILRYFFQCPADQMPPQIRRMYPEHR